MTPSTACSTGFSPHPKRSGGSCQCLARAAHADCAVETNLDAPLAQGRFPRMCRPSVQRALDANRRGAQLVQALLTLSRIQSGTIGGKQAGDVTQMSPASTARTSTDLYGCVGNSLADIDNAATKRRITITVNKAGGDADTFLIAATPALLELAVGNLLRNAVVHNTMMGRST